MNGMPNNDRPRPECLADTSGRPWTPEDDLSLTGIFTQPSGQSWTAVVAEAFPDNLHTISDCLFRWMLIGRPSSVKGPWAAEEDALLTQLVAELGAEKWVAIANQLGTRSGKQCRERWHNHLDPNSPHSFSAYLAFTLTIIPCSY